MTTPSNPNPLTILQEDELVANSVPSSVLPTSFTSGRIANKNQDLFKYKQKISF